MSNILKNIIIKQLLVVLIFLFTWQIISTLNQKFNSFVSSPTEVAITIFDGFTKGSLIIDVLASLKRVTVGFSIACLVAIPLALLLTYYRNLSIYVEPIIELLRPIPPIAWIPIAILFFGLGDNSAYFVVFIGSFFPIFINSYHGASSLPIIYQNVCKSFEIKGFVYIQKIIFYYSLPFIFTGAKIGLGMAWMSVIAAELMGAQEGLGYFIQMNRLLLRTDNVIVGMLLIGVIGLFLNHLIVWIRKLIIPWENDST